MSRKREEINPECGLRLKSLLAANGITQKEFALKIGGYTEQHISQIIRGKRRLTPEMARRIVDEVFPECRFEWLMGYDDMQTTDIRMSAIVQTRDKINRNIMDMIDLHCYVVSEEKVVCQKAEGGCDRFDTHFPVGMSLEDVFFALQKEGKYPPEMSYSEFLKANKKGTGASFYFRTILVVQSPKGSKAFLEKADFDKILSEIDDFIEFKCAFLFKRTISKVTNLYELG